jgi:hypothetical protein
VSCVYAVRFILLITVIITYGLSSLLFAHLGDMIRRDGQRPYAPLAVPQSSVPNDDDDAHETSQLMAPSQGGEVVV